MATDHAEQVALADVRPRRTADIDLPLAVADGDRADILDVSLGAIARATRRRQFQLAGAVDASEAVLDLGRQGHAVAKAEAADNPCRCTTCKSGSSCPRRARPACPRSRQTSGKSSRGMPTRSMRCPPVSLTSGTLYFTATSAIRFNSSGVQTPPGISGIDREGAVLLDVAVHPVIDEAWRPARPRTRSSRSSTAATARPGLLPGSSLPPASTLKTDGDGFEARWP